MSDNMQNDAPQANTKSRSRRWVRVVLAVSLGLNLLVVGLVGGAYFRVVKHTGAGEFPPPEVRVMRELGMGPFLSAFPHEQKRQMARQLREQVGTFRLNREALVTELGAMLEALRAEPYDHAALEVLIDRQKARISTRAETARNILLNQISSMTPEERLEFAGRLEHSLSRALERQQNHGRP